MRLAIDRLVLEVPGLTAADGERLASAIASALAEADGPGEGFQPRSATTVVLDAAEAEAGGGAGLDRLALRIAGALQREWG